MLPHVLMLVQVLVLRLVLLMALAVPNAPVR
jgi:hypothetical protein